MGSGLLVVKNGFILFIKNSQFPLQINTLERKREREEVTSVGVMKDCTGQHLGVEDTGDSHSLWRIYI